MGEIMEDEKPEWMIISVIAFLIIFISIIIPLHDSPTEITISSSGFDPKIQDIYPGKVTWTNNDNKPHHIVSDSGLFDSGELSHGQSYTYDFSWHELGLHRYHDSTNTSMKGTIQIIMGPGTY